ncbi:MAG: hypothetical protein MJZ82_03940 [Paludibacteraceae bacterium]|nr:hypothetical protein [Paludibacteraceae bacterium]
MLEAIVGDSVGTQCHMLERFLRAQERDDIACITGCIAGAFYKKIPDYIVEEVRKRLPDDMWNVIKQILLLK